MSNQTLIKWSPLEGICEKLSLEGLHDDYEGVRLLLKGESPNNRMLRISFDPALSYRNIDEGDYMKSLHSFHGGELLGKWTLFTVENSEFLQWFTKESHETHKGENITHYAVLTIDDCVDILSAYPPKVEWLN